MWCVCVCGGLWLTRRPTAANLIWGPPYLGEAGVLPAGHLYLFHKGDRKLYFFHPRIGCIRAAPKDFFQTFYLSW